MSKKIKIILLSLALVIAAAFVYWQFVKKGVIKNALQKSISQSTDSLYKITYDSSYIDEINGDARFYNIVMQSDSLIKNVYSNDTSKAGNIITIRIKQLNILGANLPAFLKNNKVEARQIDIINPVINIISTGKEDNRKFTKEDSLALYERITGKYKTIQADVINISNAYITFANGFEAAHTKIDDLNVELKNLQIDSSRNYNNLVSYFVKDNIFTANQISSTSGKDTFFLKDIMYNAPGRFIRIAAVQKINSTDKQPQLELKDIRLSGISTNDFVYNSKIKADSLVSGGGLLKIYQSASARNKGQSEFNIDNDFFTKAVVKNIELGSTTLQLYQKDKPNAKPLILNNFKMAISNIGEIKDGRNLEQILSGSKWKFSADGLSVLSKDQLNRITVGPFEADQQNQTLKINSLKVENLLSEADFVRRQKVQKDYMNMSAKNIFISGININELISTKKIIAQAVTLQPDLRIFNDRTLPFDETSKVGKYPQQQLLKLDVPIYIKTVNVKNGYVSYRERARLSKQIGDVNFKNIQATISNVTNIKEYIAKNNTLLLKAKTRFLGVAPLETTWRLTLNSPDGGFAVLGSVNKFDATKLNRITEPLGLASISSGTINKLDFAMTGNDLKTDGEETLLYEDLKIKLLKPGSDAEDDLEKKSVLSLIANLFTKNNNPSNGVTRKAAINYDRDITKSFFNLLWKSIFAGAKKTARGKSDGD